MTVGTGFGNRTELAGGGGDMGEESVGLAGDSTLSFDFWSHREEEVLLQSG